MPSEYGRFEILEPVSLSFADSSAFFLFLTLLQIEWEWLANYPAKVAERLASLTRGEDFKMPKTPMLKRNKKLRKRVFGQEEGVPRS